MILGIDPGRDKTGWAFVGFSGELLCSGIFPSDEWGSFIGILEKPTNLWETSLALWQLEKQKSLVTPSGEPRSLQYIAVGDGTGSKEATACLKRLEYKIVSANEERTTLIARDLYWCIHRPAFWQKCLPRFLRGPARDLDDLAAWAIALRSIKDFRLAKSELGRLINLF